MKYFLIAGEASGDLHGAALMRALKVSDPEAKFRFFGGEQMQAEGGTLLRHYREMAFMGFFEVVANLSKISRNLRDCKHHLSIEKPDVVVLIDYPGFNFKIAKYAHEQGLKVFWYIAPKLWAWKAWRVKRLKAYTSKVYSILPFEKEFFSKHGLDVEYIGNPLVDAVRSESADNLASEINFLSTDNGSPLVALLPGSRVQEVRLILPEMLATVRELEGIRVVISGATSVPETEYRTQAKEIPVLFGNTYALLSQSKAAIVASGTATLETALLKVPQLVVYRMKGSKLLTRLFRYFFLKVQYVSLPNLILNREAVKEFIMHEMTAGNMRPELEKLLHDNSHRESLLRAYNEIEVKMGQGGAAERAAAHMVNLLKNPSEEIKN